jgi:hypothetical protein
MITREEFKKYFSLKGGNGITDEGSPLWIPETGLLSDNKCVAFVRLNPPIKSEVFELGFIEFWDWCGDNLKGEVRCFSSNEDEEWWGFTNPHDIVLWMLKWT